MSAPVQADELALPVREDERAPEAVAAPSPRRRFRRRHVAAAGDGAERGILSNHDWGGPRLRWSMRGAHTLAFVLLFVAGVGPIVWLAKAATSTTQDTLRTPFALWPSGIDWTNLADAWTKVEISKYFGNTLWVALGSWAVQLFVATTGGFVLSVLRPRYAKVVTAAVLATLFIPGIVVLVPLFLTVLDLPLFGTSIVDTYWAVWLPAGANAFNVLLVKRFMDGLPRDVFEAAQVDGAGPFRQLLYVGLPLSRPILGVVSILAMLNAWKDYLWPLVVLPNPEIQPLSVRLPIIRETVELDVFLAALLISMALPITLFLVFQRLFLRGVSIGGAVKG
jgi:multiple sugar transport system permease protein